MSNSNNMEIAETIFAQLGGTYRLVVMAGAKNFLALESGASFKMGKNASGITHMRITLDPSDTYTVCFQRVWGTKVTEKGTHTGIYCDMLKTLFEKETGMYLTF